MRVIETNVYTFNELDQESKEKAINDHRNNYNDCDFDDYFDDETLEFKCFLKNIGFNNVETFYSGFHSQGDGACFDFTNLNLDEVVTKQEGNTYSVVHDKFIEENIKLLKDILKIKESIEFSTYITRYNYNHEKSRGIDYKFYNEHKTCKTIEKLISNFLDVLGDLYIDLSQKYYKQLSNHAAYVDSDEYIIETLINNDYEFTINGKII